MKRRGGIRKKGKIEGAFQDQSWGKSSINDVLRHEERVK